MKKSTNRRSFIKSSAALAASGLILPNILTSCETKTEAPAIIGKAEKENHIIGHGDFKYKLNKDWGTQNMQKTPVMDCHEMVQDKSGRLILATNHPKNNIIFYDRSGKVLKTWTLGLTGTHGLTISDEGGEEFLYITSNVEHKVYKTDLNGKVILEINYPKETGKYLEDGLWFNPTETTVAPNGNFYVADGYGHNYILEYDQKGNVVNMFGGKGDGDEHFDCCHGITLDDRDKSNPTLLITSRSQQEFKRFTLDGKHIETIIMPGCWICRPVIKGDNLYFAVIVTKSWYVYDGCLAVLDKNNKVLSFPGALSAPEYKEGILQQPEYDDFSFLSPHDVCIDQDENIFVPQWNSGRTYPLMLERV
ncbi:hypothetical protein OE09_0432 [Flavobacteriaceae bacterium MAR_2010_72]|nr:hypothetical protein OE09_0432 [Flavobacteriaceae bacterium MAR_2010_72]